jgi:uncharacterized protein
VSVAERMERLSNRFYDSIRSGQARPQEPSVHGFEHLRGHKYALIVTRKRSGEQVPTPVWFGVDDAGRAYVRTGGQAAKAKRIRNDPHVLLAPCTTRGKPKGPFAAGTARLLSTDEEAPAEAAIQANYGLFRKAYEGSAGSLPAYYIEVTPT